MWVHLSTIKISIWLQFSKLRYTYPHCNSQGLLRSIEVSLFGCNWWDTARNHTFSLRCHWTHVCPWLVPDTHHVLHVPTTLSHTSSVMARYESPTYLNLQPPPQKAIVPTYFLVILRNAIYQFYHGLDIFITCSQPQKSQTLCNTVNSGLIWFIHFVRIEFFPAPNMADFYVLGSDVGFPTSPPGSLKGHAGYKLCGQYPGTPPVGQISRITCEPGPTPAKYVYIQADVPAGIMNFLELCEVWVYGSKFSKIRHYGYNSFLCIYII